MPRKRKSQIQNRTTNEPGADSLPPTVNTTQPNTKPAQEKKATAGERSDGPTKEIQGNVKRHREQAPALGLHELDDGASSNARKQDSETVCKAKTERTADNHAPNERNPRSVLSTVISTNSRPKPSTWASVAARKDEEGTALDMRIDKKLRGIIHELQQNSDEGNPAIEAYPPNLGHSTDLGTEEEHPSSESTQTDTKNIGKNVPSVEANVLRTFQEFAEQHKDWKAEVDTKRAPKASQDREVKLQSLINFSKEFRVAVPVPRDLLPILTKERLKQDRMLATQKLTTNVQETAKPSNEEKALGEFQHLQEDAAVEVQEPSYSGSSEVSHNTTLLLDSPEDGQIESSNPAKGGVHDSHVKSAETSYHSPPFTAHSIVLPDEMLHSYSPIPNTMPLYHSMMAPLNPLFRPPDPVGSQMIFSGTTQQHFHNLLTPPMVAFEYGLGAIRHYTYPRGTLVPFQTLRNLGRGSMAHVEEVYIPPYRSFVRKTFLLTMSSDLRLRCRDIIHREIQVMSRLTHMHIVKVIGSYDLEPITSTILMSPVGDNDLKMFFDELSEIPPGTREWDNRRSWLWKWVGCLTSAIAYIHSQGICHKDIKPSNIVHKGDNVYLTDFSSCGQFNIGGTTSTGADARTTLVYRAPELFRTGDAGKHGPGTDVFALGLVFLEMKTVYWGTSIQRLREFYAAAASVKSADTNEFYYDKALIHIHEVLSRDTDKGDNEAWPLSSAVILSMLASERKERPSAVQVLDTIRLTWDCDFCVCTMRNATSDNPSFRPESDQENMSQISDPSAFAGPSMGFPHLSLDWREYVNPTPFKTLSLNLHDRRQQSDLLLPDYEQARLHNELYDAYQYLQQQEAQLRRIQSETQYPRPHPSR